MSTFRRWFPLETEYRARRILNAGTGRPGQPPIVHVAGWKTASQWVRMVFSDPQLLRSTGYRATYVRGRAGAPGLEKAMLNDSTLLTPVYVAADNELVEDHHRVFVVVREPIGLARSWLRTNVANHPSNVDVDARRHALAGLVSQGAPASEILAASLEHGFDETLRIGSTWIERAASDDNVLVTKFEDLTHPKRSRSELARIFEHIGFGDHLDLVDVIERRYRKANIARVERLLRPSGERKYGTGETGDEALQRSLSDDDVAGALHAFAPGLLEPLERFYSSDAPSTPHLVRTGGRQ